MRRRARHLSCARQGSALGRRRHEHRKRIYLLEHRGYTQTVVGLPRAGRVLAMALRVSAGRRDGAWMRAETARLFGVALVSTGLHLAVNALNSDGVHPFWPFANPGVYRDAVYIVEPWYGCAGRRWC